MFKNQHTSLTQETLNFNYLPASLKQNKSGWVIDYYCEDPNTRKMKRVRTRVEKIHRRYRTQARAKAHIFKIVNEINIKLMKGWNPFISADDIRLYTPFKTATEKFIAEKTKELRPDTIRSYKSFINTLNTFVDTKCPELKFSSAFNKLCAIRFMDYIYIVDADGIDVPDGIALGVNLLNAAHTILFHIHIQTARTRPWQQHQLTILFIEGNRKIGPLSIGILVHIHFAKHICPSDCLIHIRNFSPKIVNDEITDWDKLSRRKSSH